MGGFLQRAPCSRVRHHLVGAAARRLCWLATAWSCCGRCRGSPPWWSCRRGAVFCVSGVGRRMTCRGWWRRAVNKGGGGGWWWLGYGQWWLLCDKTTTPHPTKSDDRQNLVSNKPRQIAIFRCCAFVTVSRKRPSSVIMRQVGSNQTWHGLCSPHYYQPWHSTAPRACYHTTCRDLWTGLLPLGLPDILWLHICCTQVHAGTSHIPIDSLHWHCHAP